MDPRFQYRVGAVVIMALIENTGATTTNIISVTVVVVKVDYQNHFALDTIHSVLKLLCSRLKCMGMPLGQ